MNGREYDMWKTAVPYTSPERDQAISDLEALNKVHNDKSEKLEAIQKTVEFLMEEIYRLDEALEIYRTEEERSKINLKYKTNGKETGKMTKWELIKTTAWLLGMCGIGYLAVWILHCLVR